LKDQEPLVRAIAAQRITSKNALMEALGDPSRSVREGAVLSLVNLGVARPTGENGERFERAAQEYLARAAIQSDDGPEQFNAGSMYLFIGETQKALFGWTTRSLPPMVWPAPTFRLVA
jgi:hypothetical protein